MGSTLDIWQFIQISSYFSLKWSVQGSGFPAKKKTGSMLRYDKGSKVVICWHPSLYNTIVKLASFTHWVKDTRCPYWGIILIDMSLLALFNPEPLAQTWFQEVGSKAHAFNSRGLISLIMVVAPGRAWTLNCSTQVSFKTSGFIWPLRKSSAFFILYPRCSHSNPSNTSNKCHMSRVDPKSFAKTSFFNTYLLMPGTLTPSINS